MTRFNPFQESKPGSFPKPGPQPVEVALVRGTALESRHRVHVVCVDARGRLVSFWGDPERQVFPRSAVKPLQALPLIVKGIAEKLKLSEAELALACASHHGEEMHTTLVAAWLARIGCSELDLECGAHEPYHKESARALVLAGRDPGQIHNNCSGKHAGMLSGCAFFGFPTKGYTNFDHPYQELQREWLGKVYGIDMSVVPWGVDGCGIPTYAVPLEKIARGISVCAGAVFLGSEIQKAAGALNQAIRENPKCIGGTDSFCSRVVAESKGRVFAKLGAEGVYGAWVPEAGIGLALKCEDGAARAAEVALAHCLRELGFPLPFAHEAPLVRRWTGEVVGQVHCL